MKNKKYIIVVILFLCLFVFGCENVSDAVLEAPTNIKYDGTAITWSKVDNATYYTVSINNGDERKVTSNLYMYNAMNSNFTVRVTASNSLIENSSETTFNYLGSINNLSVSEDCILSWDQVDYATGYEVKIDNGSNTVVVTENKIEISNVGKHSYSVKPIIQGDNSYYSTFSDSKSITLLEQVDSTKISYVDGYISWSYISGASSYKLFINGTLEKENITSTKYLFDSFNADFEVIVQAVGDHVSSFDGKASDPQKFIYLDTVTNVKVVDGILLWDAVDKADGYRLKVNSKEVSKKLTTTQYDGLKENTTTTVQIMAYSNDATCFSCWSSEISVFLLPSPILKWNSGYDTSDTETESVYWDWSVSQNITGFRAVITDPNGKTEEIEYPITQRSISYDYDLIGNYEISVQAVSTESGIYTSKLSKAITVKRLGDVSPYENNYVVSDANDLNKGFTVTFNKLVGATKYYLYKDGVKILETSSNQFSVKDFVDKSSIEAQTYNFKVQAIGTNRLSENSVVINSKYSTALSFDIKVLGVPTVTGMEGYYVNYTQVTGSNGYSIYCGGKLYESTALSYDLSTIEAGSYEVTVSAKGNGTFTLPSNKSASFTINRIDAPTNVRIDTSEASEGVLTYDKVLYAKGYYIVFNNDGNAIPADTINNINQYITEAGTTVYMLSSANYYNDNRTIYYMTSKPSKTSNFIKLAAPTFGDVAFSNSELLWKAPANVNSSVYTPTYQVYSVNGTIYNGNKNGTRMDISYLDGGETYVFYVKAIGDGVTYINSEKSTPVSIYKLATPVVNTTSNKYTWNGVADAVSYAVYVDGKLDDTEIHVSGTTYEYTPSKFTEIKNYLVSVVAVGDEGYTSINSKPCEITQVVKQLETPEFSFSYSSDYYKNDGTIDVTITKESPNAWGYMYTIAGSTNSSQSLTYSHCPGSVGKYQVRVYAIGGVFDEAGIYYLDSQSQGGNSRYEITLLASPNPSSMTLSQDGKLTWAAINSAVSYEVKITINGETKTYTPKSNSCVLENFTNSGTVIIEIKAVGNGTSIITSETAYKEYNL